MNLFDIFESNEQELDEDLRKWFKEKWVRFGPDGKIRGDCARGDDSEGKPKCLPQSKAQSLGKKGRASAAARKRREDPNPERSGKAINVATQKKTNEGVAEGGGMPFRGVGGAFNRGDDERHDLDPTDWYFVKDGKMFAVSVYPNQEQEAISRGYSRTKDEAKAKAGQQGVAEAINPDITNPEFSHQQQIGDYLYVARYWSKGLKITAYDGAKKIGRADLMYHSGWDQESENPKYGNPKKFWLESEMTEVHPKYQRKGIMSTMYAYAKMLGNSVKPSDLQSDEAQAAWKSWRQAGDAQHLTREGVAEGAPELLKTEMPLVRHIEKELAQHGYEKGTPEYDQMFKHSIAMYRKFGNVDAIKQGVAEGKMAELEMDLEDPEITDRQFEKMYGMTRKEAREQFSQTDMWAFPEIRDPNRPLHERGVAEAFGPLPKDNQQIRLGRHTVDIERVGLDKNYISFAWNDSQGQEHYEEVQVGDLGSYDDLIDRIKDEIRYVERQYTDQGVAEGLNEMDKTQTPPGRDGGIDWTKKQIHLGPEHVIKTKDVAKHALKALDRTMKKSHADTPKKKGVAEQELDEACWKGYHKEGMKTMFGKKYPNCVKNTNEGQEDEDKSRVRRIQQYLNKEFNANLDVDGVMGPLTKKSIEKFLPSSKKKSAPNPEKTTAVQGAEVKEEHQCPHCGGELVSEEMINEKQDACYYKVKSRYKVWPSAYASGALVQCRKKGAKNWGNKSEGVAEGSDDDIWGPQGNFAGDKHVDVGGVTMKIIQVGDMVKYLGQKAEVVDLSKDRKRARIAIQKGMGGITQDVNTSDLKQLGQGVTNKHLDEKWSQKYKDSINCSNPKGFSQKAHCASEKKNEDMAEGKEYYTVTGTDPVSLRRDFNMSKDRNGWFLKENATPKQKLEAFRAFGSPKLKEYNLAAFSGGTQTKGEDNVISPVGSQTRAQYKK